MAILDDGINALTGTGAPQAESVQALPIEDDVSADVIELVSSLTVDAVLTRVREGVMDADTVVAAERRGKQRAGVLAPLT